MLVIFIVSGCIFYFRFVARKTDFDFLVGYFGCFVGPVMSLGDADI